MGVIWINDGSPCVMCGNPCAIIQQDDHGNETDPLCSDCRYQRAHSADERAAELQARYYDTFGDAVDREYDAWEALKADKNASL
jgi:hypothetical protein